ncbi:dihydroxyacetone kinase subunit DhaL [Mesoplasma lactucae]|uniref:Dihydroxyacetone kinase subunit L n=1 Tax=Mesoplasma lactucae ATCC 49193 TaxID=81460 RepID=A0A291IRL8_9MOLU|nr:dihydroxyacetone kinase subunit DhaL [Mesoplasma lactucae]ATG97439.1 dihydroxyacetone kinase subunit L [Mesoplasma lactucae ATCC 49193]ATZ20107.1 dihydroxyacetone kinase subunit L [Mesoplasma lactucae ATCC 49193]MCL8216855.1 PTS-dependent dihydroxyacetone kinase, ADP-binding subunit DhaL [Mesoplasma lactucae ATCC 49193]
MNNRQLIKLLEEINKELHENKEYLNQLDAAIGDGDHGTNVVRGFEAIQEEINKGNFDDLTPKQTLKDVAMILMSKIGGSSGPLFGTLALQMSNGLDDTERTYLDQWIKAIQSGIDGVQVLGKAQLGDKTMVDVLIPSLETLEKNINDPHKAIKEAEVTAKKAMEDTKDLEAKKGRAAYLGKRSIGHIDPGSVTIYLLWKSINQVEISCH